VHRLDAILLIALALLLGAPCSAAAYKKKGSTPKQVSPRESITFTYTKPQYNYTQQRGNNPTESESRGLNGARITY